MVKFVTVGVLDLAFGVGQSNKVSKMQQIESAEQKQRLLTCLWCHFFENCLFMVASRLFVGKAIATNCPRWIIHWFVVMKQRRAQKTTASSVILK